MLSKGFAVEIAVRSAKCDACHIHNGPITVAERVGRLLVSVCPAQAAAFDRLWGSLVGVPLGGHHRFMLFLKEPSCVLSAWPR
jgi:hypothetical protein